MLPRAAIGARSRDTRPWLSLNAVSRRASRFRALRTSISIRYARERFDRTIEDPGVLVPGVRRVIRITNPGEGVGENVLRDVAGYSTCPSQPSDSGR